LEQYDLNGIKIAEYDSASDVEKKLGISRSSIANHLMGLTKKAGGYIWNYKNI